MIRAILEKVGQDFKGTLVTIIGVDKKANSVVALSRRCEDLFFFFFFSLPLVVSLSCGMFTHCRCPISDDTSDCLDQAHCPPKHGFHDLSGR